MSIRKKIIRSFAPTIAAAVLATASLPGPAGAQNLLKIGVLGVMSGPAASWGLVNKYCAEATAQMYNDQGGVEIGGEKYKIEIVSIDDKNDPKLAVSGAERLTQQEGIKYIIGPNVDTTAASVVPVVEKNGAINFPYAFSKRALHAAARERGARHDRVATRRARSSTSISWTSKGVKSIAFVARNESDALNQRDEGVAAAKELGLEIVSVGGHLRARHHRLLPGHVEGGGRQPGPDRALGRGALRTRRC